MKEENEKVEETTPEVKGENLPPDCHCEASSQTGCGNPFSLPAAADAFPSGEGGFARSHARAKTDEVPAAADEKDDSEVEHLRAELESVRGQVTRLEHERYLLSRGLPEEDLDYYAFKIEHMEGAKSDFRKAAKEYLKAHPVRRTAVSSGADLTAGSTRRPATSSELMNQLLRNR